jgi:hypothetical protein
VPDSSEASGSTNGSTHGKNNRWAAIASVVVLLLVIVGTGAFLSRGGEKDDPNEGKVTAAPGASDPGQVITQELLPVIPEVTLKGIANGKVTFTWEREQPDDLFPYRIVDRAGKPLAKGQVTKETSVTVPVQKKGQTCIQVFARRGSKSSTSFGQACTATR